ncbi:MAG: hypothetical protein ACREDY_24620 [Bradyrhizobium sp.]
MFVNSIDNGQRERCVMACERLVEAIGVLDSCGFEVEATHAQLCLDRVWEQLDLIDRPASTLRRRTPRRVFVPPA